MARGALAVVIAVSIAPFACRGKGEPPSSASPSVAPSVSSAPVVVASASASASASAKPPADSMSKVHWTALVAAEAWEPAARAIDGLPEIERATVPARLARLRVAAGRCTVDEGNKGAVLAAALRKDPDASRHPELLARYESDSLLCAQRYKEALAVAGPGSLAVRGGALSAWARARALVGAEDFAAARKALDEAIDGAHGAGLPLGTLLAARLRVLRKLASSPEIARAIDADRKRLFVEFPAAFDVAVQSGELPTAPTLDADGWLKRADALAAAGKSEEALHAVTAAAAAGAPARKIARAKGHVLYKARAYAKAAPALKEAAALAKDDAAIEDAFLAARATSRAGDDASAIAAYEALAKAHPSSKHASEAAYLAAHLRWLSGKWNEAIAAYDRFLAGPWSKPAHQEGNVREAKRARAIALLEVGRFVEARKAFHALAESDAFAHEPFARARLELLEAIAMERSGAKPGAIALLRRLSASHPWAWPDLASRARLVRLGETVAPFGAASPALLSEPAWPEDVRLLARAGLHGEAFALFAKKPQPSDDAARCTAYAALDAGFEAYKLGLKLATDVAPDGKDGWRWRCAWPTPYAPVVAALEEREGLPRGLLHAILRQESAFRVDVVSHAGAIGIAQLMPTTAVTTASQIGLVLDPSDVAALKAPWLQLDLAARHLHQLFDELAGPDADAAKKSDVVALVAAAYNAGSGAVKRWLREAGDLDADVFVERTPFLETRGYVARVLGNSIRYAIMAGAPTPVLPTKFPKPP